VVTPNSRLITLLAVFLTFALLATLSSSFCSAEHLGVSVGDWAEYKIVRGGHGSTAWAGDFEFADSKRIEFVNVSDTFVEILETTHYTDGWDVNGTIGYDVLNELHQFKYVAPANLTIGDLLPEAFGLSSSRAQISKTVIGEYVGENRTACVAESTYSEPYAQYVLDVREEYRWDRDTGLLLKSTFETTFEGYGSASLSYASLVLDKTNLWGKQASAAPITWLPVGILLCGSAIGIAGIVVSEKDYLGRRLKNRKALSRAQWQRYCFCLYPFCQ